MDKERAKFILQSFRPDGEDAAEPAFTEALKLAAQDRGLGEWLASERAQDAAFAAMLADVEIPADLRSAISEVLNGSVDVSAEFDAEFDAEFMGALLTMASPKGLRDQILGAMEVEQKVTQMTPKEQPKAKAKRGFLRPFMWTTSAAAVLVGMFFVTVFFAGAGGSALAGTTSREVGRSAIEMLDSPFFSLDLQNDRQAALYEWLAGKNLPSPEQLPQGLKGQKGVGCKLLKIGENESRGSLVCYKLSGKVVHLVMMERVALSGSDLAPIQGAMGQCQECDQNEGWAVTQWADAEHTYLLLGKMDPGELAELF